MRALRNVGHNPHFGDEVLVFGLGPEPLQPERLLPPRRSLSLAGASSSLQRSTWSACGTERTGERRQQIR
jgi:hypothetical protein